VSNGVLHPKCGLRFANNNTEGHCAACCETFIGLRAFDKHRRGGFCNELVDGEHGFWQDDQRRWHWGPRMSPEVKARMRKCDDDAEQ
jgi:hypothetical protein